MLNEIENFLDEHPDYFENSKDGLLVRKDLRSMMDSYARAMDPSEYDELKNRVATFRAREKERLQSQIGQWVRERKEEESELEGILWELNKLEKELRKVSDGLKAISDKENAHSAVRIKKHWYNSGYVFVALDFFGVSFLYAGIILNEKLTMSYVILGVICIAVGFMLQRGGADSGNPASSSGPVISGETFDKLKRFGRIKRVTLNERKKVALGKIAELNRKIERNLDRINGINR